MYTAANINHAMLTWARERSGLSLPEFAAKLKIDEEKLTEWESGLKQPTFNQAIKFAEQTHIPFGYLFLTKPPVEELPIPDLRTIDGHGVTRPSAELVDLIKIMLQRQEWYREYLASHLAEKNIYVGRVSNIESSEIKFVVQDMRKSLKVLDHPNRGKWDDYYRDLVYRIESLGILVMRQGNMGHFTRPLKVDEFRGFALVDDYAPMIFINDADAYGARLFTLIHELCHVWIGQSGISDGNPKTHRFEEIFCNAVAAEFLVPEKEMLALWRHDFDDWQENLPPLEAHFHVSTWALARRALTLHFISHEEYTKYVATIKSRYKESDGGPSYYVTKKSQISQMFSKAVVTEALSGQLLLREASDLLGGIKPNKIEIFARELGV